MSNVLTLAVLQKFARANPTREFDLSSDSECLGCQAANREQAGHVMTGWTYFTAPSRYTQVDVVFAAFCRELHHRETDVVNGKDLARLIGRLIQGDHPRQVADEYADERQADAA